LRLAVAIRGVGDAEEKVLTGGELTLFEAVDLRVGFDFLVLCRGMDPVGVDS
jgi:hypothetical protein